MADTAPVDPRRHHRRTTLLAAVLVAVVVVLVAVGVIVRLSRADPAPAFTIGGRSVNAPASTLDTAQARLAAKVRADHGVTRRDTRCYFARPRRAAAGVSGDVAASDVLAALRCGPVLFIDGDVRRQYLTVPLHVVETSGKSVELAPTADALDELMPTAPSRTLTLVRPDGLTPPRGTGGLTVPEPPAARKDTLLATSLGTSTPPATLRAAVMVSKDATVRLVAAGRIGHYGAGSHARSAPTGQRLVAFRVARSAGELRNRAAVQAELVIGGEGRPIPRTRGDQWVVAAVPSTATAMIQLDDSGYVQTLAVPSGLAGDANIAVLARKNRIALIGQSFTVPIRFTKAGERLDVTARTSASVAHLYFWPPGHESIHPSDPQSAFLSLRLDYTDVGQPKTTFGFDPGLLSLRLPTGDVVTPRNIADPKKINDVFQVPADFTSGVITIAGTQKIRDGVTSTVIKAKSFRVSVPAR